MKKIFITILTAIITSGLFFFFYIYPNPSFLGGPSRDALPTVSDFLRIIILGLAVIASVIFIIKTTHSIKNILAYIILAFGLLYVVVSLVDSPKLKRNQQLTAKYHYEGKEVLAGLRAVCGSADIDNLIFPKEDLGGVPAREVEYICGNRSGIYDLWDNKEYELDQCQNNKTYNGFMRSIGSLKRKSCLGE